ncbi:MAG: hypothetical protein B1H11_03035 [Desulfobacteraceae bacterium 4484_190.1]|nr:MAG: hypothetical protein B1H11_03035 [Desulfobacteraceae bacterium 4484_190.1]
MYKSFFGFKEKPFNLTPDTRYLYMSPYHREALDHLIYGINERKGFVAITGGIGTGKTTLCRTLLGNLDASIKSALIFNSFISETELLSAINREFGIESETSDGSGKDYIDALNRFLLENYTNGGNAVLLIDEAQNLSPQVLEQIRMLSNLETGQEKLLQIILVGQLELAELLASPSLKQLDERITVRYNLMPLVRKEIKGYIEHRLIVAGGHGGVKFTRSACNRIYAFSHGNPRRINAVCDRALLIAYTKGKHAVSKKIAGEAILDIRGNILKDPLLSGLYGRRIETCYIFFLILIVIAVIAGWNFRKDFLRPFSDEQNSGVGKQVSSAPVLHKPEGEAATLFLDEKTSLAGLFDLYNKEVSKNGFALDRGRPGLVFFNVGPEYYQMFKKPFRVLSTGANPSSFSSQRYLLFRKMTLYGAIAIDAGGNEREVAADFIMKHWGGQVSCVYLYQDKDIDLINGMNNKDVSELQHILNKIAYLVEPTGIYDEQTFCQVRRFQKDFGLRADGIVGPRTRALLFQMTD